MLRDSILNLQEGWLPGLGPASLGRCRRSIQEGNVEMYTQEQPRNLQFRQLKGTSFNTVGSNSPHSPQALCPQACNAITAMC